MQPNRAALALRPFGYFFYGVLWLILTLIVVAFAGLMAVGPLWNYPINERVMDNPLTWVVGIPLVAWLFVIAPLWFFSEAMLGFALSGHARHSEYSDRPLSAFAGDSPGTFIDVTLEPLVDTPQTRLWVAVGTIGFRPGWRFALSSLTLVIGFVIARAVHGPVAALAGSALVAGATWASVIAVSARLKSRRAPMGSGGRGAANSTEKYLQGVAYRDKKRARELQKARDEGHAPGAKEGPPPTAFDRWAAAEAEHALRQCPTASRDARLGVPGALDAAIAAVTSAMYWHVTSEEAEQFVIDAAAFRGKKPVRVMRPPDTSGPGSH